MRITDIFPKSKLEKLVFEFTKNRNGVAIGGSSKRTGRLIYKNATIIDNVIFSENTVWAKHDDHEYKYYKNKIGKVIINEATNIIDIESNIYDFVFASHVLEHIANPLKALKEWLRITKKMVV